MVTVKDWESGKVKLQDEFFDPVFDFHFLLGFYVTKYIGQSTGTVLESGFVEVLE